MNNLGDSVYDEIKTSIECNPAMFITFTSKTEPMRTLSHKLHAHSESGLLRGGVLSADKCPSPFVQGSGQQFWDVGNFCEETCIL